METTFHGSSVLGCDQRDFAEAFAQATECVLLDTFLSAFLCLRFKFFEFFFSGKFLYFHPVLWTQWVMFS